MRFVSDPAIAIKIARMKQRVRWQHPLITKYGIDQTHLEISDKAAPDNIRPDNIRPDNIRPDNGAADTGAEAQTGFSFLVIGDSGTSRHLRDQPQRRITERLLAHLPECQFILHTGDVVYLSGSSEQYPDNFIKPYREFIVGGENPHKIRFDQMTFNLPFLPTLGNHDYYDLSRLTGLVSRAFSPLRRLLRRRINLDVGWHGSFQGEGFTKAFLDYLQPLNNEQLEAHLQKHYTSQIKTGQSKTGRCLKYVPGEFTRLPNRYYSFRQHGIDFFALDSNTFNAPQPLPRTEEGRAQRKKIAAQREQLESRVRSLLLETAELNMDLPEQADRATHIYAKIEQIEEQLGDIDKQLTASHTSDTLDVEQLNWLRDRLIASWQDPLAKGRVLYFHHPPYVTESTKWFQGQTLAVRAHLRRVLDEVEAAIGPSARPPSARPLVDLVLSGHAHCFEYLQTQETGHGDRNIAWVVCGGSGFSLRRQREEGPVLEEQGEPVAKCHLFIGRSGHGSHTRRPYSALRVDICFDTTSDTTSDGSKNAPQFVLRPLVAERYEGEWQAYDLDKIVVSSPFATQRKT
jgi:hypothetical protein